MQKQRNSKGRLITGMMIMVGVATSLYASSAVAFYCAVNSSKTVDCSGYTFTNQGVTQCMNANSRTDSPMTCCEGVRPVKNCHDYKLNSSGHYVTTGGKYGKRSGGEARGR